MSKIWKWEVGVFVLLMLLLPPGRFFAYFNDGPAPRPQLNCVYQSSFNHAMGLHFRHLFPCFSPAFEGYFKSSGPQVADLNLLEKFQGTQWPENAWTPFYHRGSDALEAFLIEKIWRTTGIYSIAVVTAVYRITFYAVIGVFFFSLLCTGLPGLALLGGLALAYSPLAWWTLHSLTLSFGLLLACVTISALASLIRLQDKSKHSQLIRNGAGVVVFAAVVAAAGLYRKPAFYALIPVCGLWIARSFNKGARAYRLAALAALLLATGFLSWGNHIIWTPQRLQVNQQSGHVFWHSIWCGLGEFPNPYGFVFGDYEAKLFAEAQNPKVEFASDEYEAILRRHVLTTVTHHPLWFAKVLAKRAWKVSTGWIEFLPFNTWMPNALAPLLLLISAAIVLHALARKKLPWAAAMVLGPALFYLAIPMIVCSSYAFYNLPAYFGLSLLFVTAICLGIKSGARGKK